MGKKGGTLLLCLFLMLLSACGTSEEPAFEIAGSSATVEQIDSAGQMPDAKPVIPADIEQESEPVDEPEPEPEREETIDPSSRLLPDIYAFLYHSPSTEKRYNDNGWQSNCNGSHPDAAYETVKQELLDLLAEDRYQLELVESTLNPHYSGIDMHEFFYTYTGTSNEIKMLVDEHEEHEFNVRLRITHYPEYDYFKFGIVFSRGFDLEDPGTRTTRDIAEDGDGGILTEVPNAGSGNNGSDFFKKCSACHGSGNCTHCGGDDEVEKFQAGLGWVDQNCTFCTSGRCRSCGGSGKD